MFNYRQANENDIEELLDMLRLFHSRSPYCTIQWDADDVSTYLFSLLDNGVIFMAEDLDGYPVGCVGFELGTLPFNGNYWIALEKFFYVRDHYRTTKVGNALLTYAEAMLKEGEYCNAIVMASLSTSPEHLEAWYGKRGYTKIESGFMKEVG
jgi:GNAT superfamily N-acetyltransferase